MTEPLYTPSNLVARLQAGDVSASTDLRTYYENGTRFLIRRRLKTRSLTEEGVAEVFKRAEDHLGEVGLAEDQTLSAFMVGLIRPVAEEIISARRLAKTRDGGSFVPTVAPYHLAGISVEDRVEMVRTTLAQRASAVDREVLFHFYLNEDEVDLVAYELHLEPAHVNLVLLEAKDDYRKLLDAKKQALGISSQLLPPKTQVDGQEAAHQAMRAEHMADRYIMKQLNPFEARVFEEHMIDCPTCISQLEMVESLHKGLKQAATEGIRTDASPHPSSDMARPWVVAALSVALTLTLVATIFFRGSNSSGDLTVDLVSASVGENELRWQDAQTAQLQVQVRATAFRMEVHQGDQLILAQEGPVNNGWAMIRVDREMLRKGHYTVVLNIAGKDGVFSPYARYALYADSD